MNYVVTSAHLHSQTKYARYFRVPVYESVSTSLVSVSVGCLSILGDRTLFRSPVYFPTLKIGSFETMQPRSRRLQIISVRRSVRVRAYMDNEFESVALDYVMRMDDVLTLATLAKVLVC